MKKILLTSLVATSLLMSAELAVDKAQLLEEIKIAQAQEKAAKARVKKLQAQLPANEAIVTHTELGYIKTDGNTNTDTFMLEVNLKKGWDKHSLEFDFDAQYAEDDGVESKNKFSTTLEYAYAFTPGLEGTYIVGYKQDKFAGFDYQAFTGLGARYLTFKTSSQKLSLEANLLYSQDKIEDIHFDNNNAIIHYPNPKNTPTATTKLGYKNNYASYRAKLDYKWQMLSNLSFSQLLRYRAQMNDNKNFFVYSKTALTTKISDIFSAGASYKIDYVNIAPTGKEHTDRTFTLNLIMDY